METENRSQLAKDLSRALFVCQLRDDLVELLEDAAIQDNEHTEKRVRDLIKSSYSKATVLLACTITESKAIHGASAR